MENKTRKKVIIGIGVFILLLIITNPSLTDFKEFHPSGNIHCKKSNFLTFSTYEVKIHRTRVIYNTEINDGIMEHYLGVCKNFCGIN
jgi:hypothetical protein